MVRTGNRYDDDESITYTIIVGPGAAGIPPDTTTITMPKFNGGSPKAWLRWRVSFKSLRMKTKWSCAEAADQLLLLIGGTCAPDVERLYKQAQLQPNKQRSVAHVLSEIGNLLVPRDYHDVLEDELYELSKRRSESVQELLQRLQELVRLSNELPTNPVAIEETQQCRYFRRAMPTEWQHNLAISGRTLTKLSELVMYFEGLEDVEKRQERNSTRNGKPDGQKNRIQAIVVHGNDIAIPHKREPTTNSNDSTSSSRGTWCSYHKTKSHNTTDCLNLKKCAEEHPQPRISYPHGHEGGQHRRDLDATLVALDQPRRRRGHRGGRRRRGSSRCFESVTCDAHIHTCTHTHTHSKS